MLGEGDDHYFYPEIPASKEDNAREVHAAVLRPDERVLVLYDDTVFGAADDGFVLTTTRICWRNIMDDPCIISWASLDPATVSVADDGLVVAGRPLHITTGDDTPGFAARVVALVQSLASGPSGR